jgi:hypothetical protein
VFWCEEGGELGVREVRKLAGRKLDAKADKWGASEGKGPQTTDMLGK